MKKILIYVIYFFSFIFFLITFLPKEQLYFSLEKKLENKSIVISDEVVKSSFFTFKIKNSKVYHEDVEVLSLETIKINTYMFFNEIKIKNVVLENHLSKMFPFSISQVYLYYSLFDYEYINIEAQGKFGLLKGKIKLSNNTVYLNLEPSSLMKKKSSFLLNQMNKKDGRYEYEHKL